MALPSEPPPRATSAGPPVPVLALISLYDFENNALRQLAPALRAAGYRVLEIYFKDWQNNTFAEPSDAELARLREVLDAHDVRLVGLSLRASAYEGLARRLVQHIRRPDRRVIGGGWHVTVRPDDCLEFMDAVALGEADVSLPEFVGRFYGAGDWASVPGFWVRRDDGSVVRNGPAPFVRDLDRLPWRDYTHPDKLVIHRNRLQWRDPMERDPQYQVAATIGCIQRCAFCHNSHVSAYRPTGGTPRWRSVDSLMEELAAARRRNPGIRRIRFDDEIFGLDDAWLEEFARRYPVECGLPFDILSEPRVVTERYARQLARAGARVVHLGIQHDDRVSQAILARRASNEQTRRAVQHLSEAGLFIRYLVMVDIPGIEDAQHLRLVEFLLEVPRPFDLYLFSLTLFPGSAMVEQQLASGELHPSQVEGRATKTFSQYRADLGHPRSPRDRFWLAMLVLASNPLVPRELVRRLARNPVARSHADALAAVAATLGLAKTGQRALQMARSGELTPTMVRRWLSMGSWITT